MNRFFNAWIDIRGSTSADEEPLTTDDERFPMNSIVRLNTTPYNHSRTNPQLIYSERISRTRPEDAHNRASYSTPRKRRPQLFDLDDLEDMERLKDARQTLNWLDEIRIENTSSPQLLLSPTQRDEPPSLASDSPTLILSPRAILSPNKQSYNNFNSEKSAQHATSTEKIDSSELKIISTPVSKTQPPSISVIVKINPIPSDADHTKTSMQHCLYPIVDIDESTTNKNIIDQSNQISGLVIVNPVAFGSASFGAGDYTPSRVNLTQCYQFDHVLWPLDDDDNDPSREAAYGELSNMTGIIDDMIHDAAVQKRDSTLFAYGGESTGRTQSLLGFGASSREQNDDNISLLEVIAHRVFSHRYTAGPCNEQASSCENDLDSNSSETSPFFIFSMYEIVDGDKFYDLLLQKKSKRKRQKKIRVMEHAEGAIVQNLVEIKVHSFATFQEIIRIASEPLVKRIKKGDNRHVIAKIKVPHQDKNGKNTTSSIQFVDLGFEATENIFGSDSHNLVSLFDKNPNKKTTEKESKLIKIVKKSLSCPNNKAVIMATVCPTRKSYTTTFNTLSYVNNFATKVRGNEKESELTPTRLFVVESHTKKSRQKTPNEPRFFLSPTKSKIGERQRSCHDMVQLLASAQKVLDQSPFMKERSSCKSQYGLSRIESDDKSIATELSGTIDFEEEHNSFVKSLQYDFEEVSFSTKEKTALDDSRDRFEALEQALNEIQTEKDALEISKHEEISKYEEISNLKEAIAELQQKIIDTTQENELKNEKNEQTIRNLQETIAALQAKVHEPASPHDTVHDLQDQLTKLRAELQKLSKLNEGLEKGMDLLGDELSETVVQLEKADKAKAKLLEENERFLYLKDRDDEEKLRLKNELRSSKKDMHGMSSFFQSEFTKLSSALEVSKKQVQSKLKSRGSEIERLKQDLKESRSDVDVILSEKKALEEELNRVKVQKIVLETYLANSRSGHLTKTEKAQKSQKSQKPQKPKTPKTLFLNNLSLKKKKSSLGGKGATTTNDSDSSVGVCDESEILSESFTLRSPDKVGSDLTPFLDDDSNMTKQDSTFNNDGSIDLTVSDSNAKPNTRLGWSESLDVKIDQTEDEESTVNKDLQRFSSSEEESKNVAKKGSRHIWNWKDAKKKRWSLPSAIKKSEWKKIE